MKTSKAKPRKATPATERAKPGTSQGAAEARKVIFCETYIANGGNATEAAIAAGFSAKTAGAQGSRLLKDVKVQEILKERRGALAEKFQLRTENVLSELAKIVYADPRKAFDANGRLLPISEWPDEVAAMIASVEVDELFDGAGKDREHIGYTKKIKLWDKNAAIEKAMKHLGLFKEDNEQRHGALDDLPRSTVKAILERLSGLKR